MKPHINAQQLARQMTVNRLLRRLPFYQDGAAHLTGTKHSRVYGDFGYPLMVDFWFFYSLYKRCGLAHAIVQRPSNACWLTHPKIKLDEDTEDEDFKAFARRLRLWPNLSQLDQMQRVGHYAGLILTIADNKHPSQPVESTSMDNIVAIMPAWEAQLVPGSIDNDPQSPRCGLPETYTYSQRGIHKPNQRDGGDSYTVHHSRVLIWNEGAAGRTIYGTSCLEAAYNACLDWEKIRGAGAEGFFKQAAMRGWLQDTLKGEVTQGPSDDELSAVLEAFQDMSESFDALPYLGGMELKNFTASLANPEHFKNAALEDAAAAAGWSAKGLVGAQTGVLAGSEDGAQDMRTAQWRRENYLTYQIDELLQWLERYCTDFDGERIIEFDDLAAPSDSARLDNVVKMQQVNQAGALTGIVPFTAEEMREAAGYENEEWVDEFADGVDVPDNE